MVPNDRKYTESHEWVKIDGDLAVIGITEHAQSELGDITFVELAEVDETRESGEECGEIESVKAASDVYTPVGGTVAEVNEALEEKPQLINQSPFEEGWLIKLKDYDQEAWEKLLDAADYEKILKES